MLAETRSKLQNAETSIAFLQTEHAKMLEGLHGEIQNLQQKCAHLTFQLAMREPAEETPIRDCQQTRQLKETLKAANNEIMQLRSSVSMRDETVKLLEHQLRDLEQRYQSQLEAKELLTQKLQTELDSQSSSVAYLTMKLHQSKQKYRKAMEQLRTLYSAGYLLQSADTPNDDDIKRLEKNAAVRMSTPPSSAGKFSHTSRSEPTATTKQYPMNPRPPSTPRTVTPSSRVRRNLLKRSTSLTVPLPVSTDSAASAPDGLLEDKSPATPTTETALNPVVTQHSRANIDVSDILDLSSVQQGVDKLQITTSSHPVLPPIQDRTSQHQSWLDWDNDEDCVPHHGLVRSQQRGGNHKPPVEGFVGIHKMKNLSSARRLQTASSDMDPTGVLIKDDPTGNTH